MIIEARGSNIQTVHKLTGKADNAIRLVCRVAKRHHRLKEGNLLRLVHALVLCPFTYVAALHKGKRSESDKLNTLIRRVVERVLGLPITTSTHRLLELGVRNALEEIAEAQERAQMIRLTTTKTGRQILQELGYFLLTTQDSSEFTPVPRELRDLITIAPIPQNAHLEHNRGRRLARATAFLKCIDKRAGDVVSADAAAYHDNRAFAAVAVSSSQRTLNAATVLTRAPG